MLSFKRSECWPHYKSRGKLTEVLADIWLKLKLKTRSVFSKALSLNHGILTLSSTSTRIWALRLLSPPVADWYPSTLSCWVPMWLMTTCRVAVLTYTMLTMSRQNGSSAVLEPLTLINKATRTQSSHSQPERHSPVWNLDNYLGNWEWMLDRADTKLNIDTASRAKVRNTPEPQSFLLERWTR